MYKPLNPYASENNSNTKCKKYDSIFRMFIEIVNLIVDMDLWYLINADKMCNKNWNE